MNLINLERFYLNKPTQKREKCMKCNRFFMCSFYVTLAVLCCLIACHYECIIINININLFLLIELQEGPGPRLSWLVYNYFHKKNYKLQHIKIRILLLIVFIL